jgi:hypothetical protein
MKMTDELANKILRHTIEGGKLHCILRSAFGMASNKHFPRFGNSAIITSDGYVMADFVDAEGLGHHSAFVGAWDDIARNVQGLMDHMKLNDDDRSALAAAMMNWISRDYRMPGAHPAVSVVGTIERAKKGLH